MATLRCVAQRSEVTLITAIPSSEIRFAAMFYQDHGPFVTQKFSQSRSVRKNFQFPAVSLNSTISTFKFPVLFNLTSKDLGLIEYKRAMQLDRRLSALGKLALLISLIMSGFMVLGIGGDFGKMRMRVRGSGRTKFGLCFAFPIWNSIIWLGWTS